MKNDPKPGFVYILANESFKKPWLKIGRTVNLDARLNTLKTSTPRPFEIVAVLKTADTVTVEGCIHDHIKNLAKAKWAEGTEFFLIDREQAIRSLFIAAKNRSELDGFTEYLEGHQYKSYTKAGKPVVQDTPVTDDMAKALFHTRKKGTDIRMKVRVKGEYVVLAGSLLDPMTDSFPKTNPKDHERRKLIESQAKDGRSACDETFASPSASAATFLGSSSNGRNDWIDENGKRLGEYIPKGW